MLAIQLFGGRGSGGGKRASGGGGGGSAPQKTMQQRARDGEMTAKELGSMRWFDRAAMMKEMPIGTRITGTVGGKTVTYTKEPSGKWRPSGSTSVNDKQGRKIPQTAGKAANGINISGIVYPRK